MSFGYKTRQEEQDVIIEFVGVIDELAYFDRIDIPPCKRLILDMKGIRLLNSVGLRSWVNWTKTLPAHPIIVLRNCSSVVVHQMNVLQGFIPLHAIVESFQVPYSCLACGKEENFLAKRSEHYFEKTADEPKWIKIPTHIKCTDCGKECEQDIVPLKYFHFLETIKT